MSQRQPNSARTLLHVHAKVVSPSAVRRASEWLLDGGRVRLHGPARVDVADALRRAVGELELDVEFGDSDVTLRASRSRKRRTA